jgi:endonuclease/exonuclease/phosphatase family metal-dependent hydrolase
MASRTRRALACALTLALIIAPAAVADAATRRGKHVDVTVMTRNIYLGGDIFRPIGAPDLAEFERRAGELWDEVRSTSFPTRAKLLAREVERTRPDLIGMQEVALWRRGPQGLKDGATTPSRRVVYDFLASYRRELRRLGLHYRVGAKQREADIEAPIDEGYDIRLTVFDVILVKQRKGLRLTGRLHDNYEADIAVPTPAGTLTSRRGWAAVDARLEGKRFRFVNTHLEAALDTVRDAQAAELTGPDSPLRVPRAVILTGDMNSDPLGREDTASAYDLLTGFGLVDTWAKRFGPGLTFGLSSEVRDTTTEGFDRRIDFIFAKPEPKVLRGRVVGNRLRDRAPNGLWPSDHAGAVTRLRLR